MQVNLSKSGMGDVRVAEFKKGKKGGHFF